MSECIRVKASLVYDDDDQVVGGGIRGDGEGSCM